jgi:SAM-dependent methyltransferase
MTTPKAQPPLDENKLSAFVDQVLNDQGAAFSIVLMAIGDRLGLYRALAQRGPLDSAELAAATGATERYVREWLINQAAGGILALDPATGRYALPAEHAAALTDEGAPFFLAGGVQCFSALVLALPRIIEAFRTGAGMPWGDHDPNLFEGTERLFRPSYQAYIASQWVPAVDGLRGRLEAGALMADVGCGHGASTIILARGFPRSTFLGFDSHAPSIERAARSAREAGLSNVRFEVADAAAYPGRDYDAVAYFDCFHDLGDPAGSARRSFHALKPDGLAMVVEPMAGRTVEENFNPIGRMFSGASVLCCTPNALASGKHALGTVASDEAIGSIFREAGFAQFRRATETPFNRVFEVKK